MAESKQSFLNNKVLGWVAAVMGTVLSGLAVAAAVGGYTAVQTATTELRVLNANMANVVGQITDLKSDLSKVKADFQGATHDRWSKTDHLQYASDLSAGLSQFKAELLSRVNDLSERVYELNRLNLESGARK